MHLREVTSSRAHWAAALGLEGEVGGSGGVRAGGKMVGSLEA